MKTKLIALATSALATIVACSSAQAAESWVATQTLRHVNPSAVMKDTMKPGEAVHVALALQVHDKAGLDAFVRALSSGGSKHRLTSAEFLSHYAPTTAETQAVVAHLRQSGFTNVQVAKNHMLVTADGTAATAKTAFNTDLRHATIDGRDAYANVTDAQVPAHLGGIVGSVLGLQTVSELHSMKKRQRTGGSGDGVRLTHDASDFSTLYGADSLPPATNATLAIVAVGNLYLTLNDLTSYVAMKGYPALDAETILPDGPADNYYGDDYEEWNMDSQASIGAAGGQVKQMLFYDVPDYSDAALEAAFNGAVADNRAQTVSVSIGECELYAYSSGFQAASDLIFEIAIAQGQTFAFATGDIGSWQCDEEYNGSSYPAVSPWVMAIGGTTLITGDDLTSYVDEKAWSCVGRAMCVIDGGTGGGLSVTTKLPSWQSGVVVNKKKGADARMRGIPDVAFDADPYTGLNLWDHGAVDGPIGGTSLSTPIFAGLWARIQSAHDNSLGFPGMSLYGLHATDASVFHDVTFGKNGGYHATPGWDPVSGFGSFDAAKLSAFIDANIGAFAKAP